jgi:transposase
MKQYKNGTDTSYIICVGPKGIRVILSCKGEREYPENKTNFVGVDVNTKHNLIQCSDNSYVDYDRRVFSSLATELKKIDSLKEQDKEYVVGVKREKKVNHLRRELQSNTRTRISGLCKKLKASGYDHAVFENLDKSWGRTRGKTPEDINQNRLMTELHICSLKKEFEHIARKHGIATSFVHPEYTSQTCSMCGCVDKENRESQEEFKCVECGYETNADLNASVNIRDRVVLTVLRDELLQKTSIGNGTYEPKPFKRGKVKKVLLSFRERPPTKNAVDKEF